MKKPIKMMIQTPDGRLHPWSKGDFHSQFGMVSEQNIQKCAKRTSLQYPIRIFNPAFPDRIKNIHRGPATPSLKDIGLILAHTGIGKSSMAVDAGTGSGVLAACLANICKKVVTYERRKEFAAIAKKNFKLLGVKPIVKVADITKAIGERNLDLITLDLPEPWPVLKHAAKALKPGAFLVCYLPSIAQVQRVVEAAKKHSFFLDRVTECLERSWIIDPPVIRPEHHALTHSAFLVFFRRG